MAYSKELFEYGREILNRRRQRAFQTLEERKRELYVCVPRLEQIEKELSMTGYAAIRAAMSGKQGTNQGNESFSAERAPIYSAIY